MIGFPRKNMPGTRLGISILSGLHAGTGTYADSACCHIGADTACDFALLDLGIQPRHLRVAASGSAVIIEAVDGDAIVNETTPLAAGRGMRSALPVRIRIGDVHLRLHAEEAPGRTQAARGRLPARAWHAVLFACVLGALGLLQAHGLEQAGAAVRYGDEQARTAPAGLRTADTAEVGAALQQRLAAAGLDKLAVSREQGLLRLSGTINASAQSSLHEVQHWFDATYGSTLVLQNAVEVAAPTTQPQLRIRAVWQGPKPYIVDGQGERRYTGAVLDGGWILAGIETGRVVLQRGGEEFSLTL
jgi:hypothetical protein